MHCHEISREQHLLIVPRFTFYFLQHSETQFPGFQDGHFLLLQQGPLWCCTPPDRCNSSHSCAESSPRFRIQDCHRVGACEAGPPSVP